MGPTYIHLACHVAWFLFGPASRNTAGPPSDSDSPTESKAVERINYWFFTFMLIFRFYFKVFILEEL